ncbi:MAG: hypothetical protein ABGX16_04540 [Pirellulales bacterium]
MISSVGMLIAEAMVHQIPSGKYRLSTLTHREFVKDSLPPLTAAMTFGGLEQKLSATERRERRKLPVAAPGDSVGPLEPNRP